MLSKSYQFFYRDFQRDLLQLQEILQNPAASSALKSAFQQLQRSLQPLLTLDASELDSATASKIQSYQTEMNRLVRLLGMDMMFLQAARQSDTTNQRLQQASDRVNRLLQYCEAVLREEGG